MAAGTAALGPGARPRGPAAEGGPESRARPGSAARPAPAAPTTLPGPKGAPAAAAREPAAPPPAASGQPPTPPGRLAVPAAAAETPARPRRLGAHSPPALVLQPGPASARATTTPAAAAPAPRKEPCGPRPGKRRRRDLRRTEKAHCSNRQGAELRARRSSPLGQTAWRRDLTPYEACVLVTSQTGRSHSRGPGKREAEARPQFLRPALFARSFRVRIRTSNPRQVLSIITHFTEKGNWLRETK